MSSADAMDVASALNTFTRNLLGREALFSQLPEQHAFVFRGATLQRR